MKRFFILIICGLCIFYIAKNCGKFSDFLTQKTTDTHQLIINDQNAYAKKDDFLLVDISQDYIPYSYGDLINIIYTVINNGWDTFTFYCPSEYQNCLKDIENISTNDITLTHLNNYVHPFNSFSMIRTSMLDSGEVTITVTHVYTQEQINAINLEINRIMSLIINQNSSLEEKIKTMHDYIISNTKYDQTDYGDYTTTSSIAYGTLFEHLATCNGYTDTMAIFLNILGIPNYKIATTSEDLKNSSTGHIWNAVYLNNQWLHIDLTWDDPITNTNEDLLYHKYFLITTEEMQKIDAGEVNIEEHNFNNKYYPEFNPKSQKLL